MNQANENASDRTLERAIELALEPGAQCGDPETWHRLAIGELTGPRSEELLRHAGECPTCAAERDLARLFDSSRQQRSTSEFEVARISSKVRSRMAGSGDQPSERHESKRRSASWSWAAAALVIMTAGVLLRQEAGRLPEITSPGSLGSVRGGQIELTFPVGDIMGQLDRFEWSRFAGSDRYELVVERVDGSIAWRLEPEASSVVLPAEIAALFSPAVTYRWRVRAIGSDGEEIGSSRQIEFRIDPKRSSVEIP